MKNKPNRLGGGDGKENIVGANIKRLRQKLSLTQEELALRSGLSQAYITQLENGKRRFTQKSLELISTGMGIEMHRFFMPSSVGGPGKRIK